MQGISSRDPSGTTGLQGSAMKGHGRMLASRRARRRRQRPDRPPGSPRPRRRDRAEARARFPVTPNPPTRRASGCTGVQRASISRCERMHSRPPARSAPSRSAIPRLPIRSGPADPRSRAIASGSPLSMGDSAVAAGASARRGTETSGGFHLAAGSAWSRRSRLRYSRSPLHCRRRSGARGLAWR